jgi:hypothetical protein
MLNDTKNVYTFQDFCENLLATYLFLVDAVGAQFYFPFGKQVHWALGIYLPESGEKDHPHTTSYSK